VSPDSHLVKTLSAIYQEHTGDNTPPVAIGGGTYAKAFKNCVAFGPLFPGEPETMHSPNEFWGFTGIARNFDIISDGKNDYALEINLRQGRSCDYMRAAGVNIGELISKSVKGEKIEAALNVGKVYWHYPCHEVVRALCDVSDLKEAEELMSAGLEFSPLEYPPDTEKSILRRAYVEHHSKRLMRTFFKNER
jgi:hypothetical protein